jgi:hypothetical protein
MQLIHPQRDDIQRIFGFQIFDFKIKQNWYQFSKDEKDQMKKFSIELLANVNSFPFSFEKKKTNIREFFFLKNHFDNSKRMGDIVQEKTFAKEKSASLVVEIFKREWPQNWPSFISDLLQVMQKNVKGNRFFHKRSCSFNFFFSRKVRQSLD